MFAPTNDQVKLSRIINSISNLERFTLYLKWKANGKPGTFARYLLSQFP
jgi:hypothetical protein